MRALLYGRNPVMACLAARSRRHAGEVLLQDALDLDDSLLDALHASKLRIRRVPKYELDQMIQNRPHQGIVLPCDDLTIQQSDDLPPLVSKSVHGSPSDAVRQVWLALDSVVDPMNLGALLRSAYLFGVDRILIARRNSAPLTATVSKASAGALELVYPRIQAVDRMDRALSVAAQEANVRVLATSLRADRDPRFVEFNGLAGACHEDAVTILALGSEGFGLRTPVFRACNAVTSIPHVESAVVDSLNVSVAGGILLHELTRGRGFGSTSTLS
jgi:21S rRNA (GM2251-2'-O)-methyltransferase